MIELAIEFQGRHHYVDTDYTSALVIAERDEEKRLYPLVTPVPLRPHLLSACQKIGISLIVVPHWWKGGARELRETIERQGGSSSFKLPLHEM